MPNFGSGRLTMITSQSALSTANVQVIAADPARQFVEVKNMDAAISVYIGPDSALTTANGYLLKAGESFALDRYNGAIFAIAASGTPNMSTVQW